MTLSGFGMLAAVVVLFAGGFYFSRKPDLRTRWLGTAGSLVVAIVLGWLAWYVGVSPATG